MISNIISILVIAVSLALDACAVSVCTGITVPGFRPRQAVKMSLVFGGFQFLMPLIGWLLGTGVAAYIEAVDHYVAFLLLAVIGGNMIRTGLRNSPEEAPTSLSPGRLTLLAVATSIDALVVGVSMAFTTLPILVSAVVIGVVAFLLSMAGGLAGKRLGTLFHRRASIVGGIVLILIGLRILIEHLTAV